MKPLRRIVYLVIALLSLAAIACNLPGARLGGPQPPDEAPQPSPDALQSFNDKWRSLELSTLSGPFSVTFTEAELTSALDEGIRRYEAEAAEPLPIQNPQVVLQDGQIYLYAQLRLEVTQAAGLIVATPVISPAGLVDIQINSAEFGPIEVDPSLLEGLAAELEQAINAPIQASPSDISLTQVAVADGQMLVSGTIAP